MCVYLALCNIKVSGKLYLKCFYFSYKRLTNRCFIFLVSNAKQSLKLILFKSRMIPQRLSSGRKRLCNWGSLGKGILHCTNWKFLSDRSGWEIPSQIPLFQPEKYSLRTKCTGIPFSFSVSLCLWPCMWFFFHLCLQWLIYPLSQGIKFLLIASLVDASTFSLKSTSVDEAFLEDHQPKVYALVF